MLFTKTWRHHHQNITTASPHITWDITKASTTQSRHITKTIQKMTTQSPHITETRPRHHQHINLMHLGLELACTCSLASSACATGENIRSWFLVYRDASQQQSQETLCWLRVQRVASSSQRDILVRCIIMDTPTSTPKFVIPRTVAQGRTTHTHKAGQQNRKNYAPGCTLFVKMLQKK